MDVEVIYNQDGTLRAKLFPNAVRAIVKRNTPPETLQLEEEIASVEIQVSKEIKEKIEAIRRQLEVLMKRKYSDDDVMNHLMNALADQ